MSSPPLPISVVVPVRNAEDFTVDCLESVLANHPAEVIVVDGCSTDRTLSLVRRYASVRVVSDEGSGLPNARMMGARAAACPTVALVDVDVVLPPGSLGALYEEYLGGGYAALQAGLIPGTLGDGYWGRALAAHQRIGRSRHWVGVCATLVDRDKFLGWGLDASFRSGEDIELRHRMVRDGARVGVSSDVRVHHRFRDTFADARAQWRDDGQGLARMIRKNGWREVGLLALPVAAAARGVLLTIWRSPSLLPYWLCYMVFNYIAMLRTIGARAATTTPAGEPGLSLRANAAALAVTRIAPMLLGLVSWMLAARSFEPSEVGLAAAGVAAAALVSHLTLAGMGHAMILLLPQQPDGGRRLSRVGGLTAGATAACLATVLVLLAQSFSQQLQAVVAGTGLSVLFVTLACGLTVAFYLDHVAVGSHRSDRAMGRSLAQSLTFLGGTILGATAAGPADGMTVILTAATAGALVSCLIGWRQQARSLSAETSRPPVLTVLRQLARLGSANYLLTVAQRAPMYALPLVITETMTAEANAAWYAVWMMSMALWYVPNSVGYGLQARLATTGARSQQEVRHAQSTGALFAVPVTLGLLLGAPLVLGMLGPLYSDALPVLWILLPVGLLALSTETWMAVCRVRRRYGPATAVHALAGVTAVTLAAQRAEGGLVSVAVVWTLSQTGVALYAAIDLSRERRRTSPPETPATSHPALNPHAGGRQ